jgi:hypothetical protein
VVWTNFPMNLVVIKLHNFGVFGSTPCLLWLVQLVCCNFLKKNKAKCKCPLQLKNSTIRIVAKGENRLWMGQDCYHIVLFFKGAHVWTSTMSLLKRIFTMFLHVMVGQNKKKSNAKEITFHYFIWCDVRHKTNVHHYELKMQITQKLIEIIFNLHEICNIY